MLNTTCLEKNVVKMTNLSPSAHQMPTHPLNFGSCFGLQMWSPQITSHPLSCSTPNSEHFWASDSVTLNEKLANI